MRKILEILAAVGSIVLNGFVVPLLIEQYPEYFKDNPWILPISVVVSASLALPLLLHYLIPVLIGGIHRQLGTRYPVMAWIVVIAVGALVGAGIAAGGYWLLLKHERHLAKSHLPNPPDNGASITPVPLHSARPTITMSEYGSEPGSKIYATIRVESPPPSDAPFHLLLATRVQDSTVDEMEDTQIGKSSLLPVTGQTIEVVVPQRFLERAYQLKFVRVILILLPAPIQSDQIAKLSDVIRVGGQIAINNSFVMRVLPVVPKAGANWNTEGRTFGPPEEPPQGEIHDPNREKDAQ